MKYGMISTGSKEATLTACEILENNGNAFDAAIGAVFTSMVSEHCLTGPCGGGVMLASPKNREPIIYDFFVDAIPLDDNSINKKDFFPVTVDFGNAKQIFHTGKSSIGIPGTLIGLIQAHKELGKVPLENILKPAIYYAKSGAIINKSQFYIQLVTAAIFFYVALLDEPISIPKILISILLLLSWSLGYIRNRIERRRIRSNWKTTRQIQKIKTVKIDKET